MTTTPQAALLSESEIVVCIAKAGCIGTVKMSYESGPYDIYRPSINASRLYDAIEAAIIAKLQATQEPVQAGELPAFEQWWRQRQLLTFPKDYDQSLLADWGAAYEPAAKDAWQARAALSARKPLPYDLICNAIDLADTESMKGDYMLDSGDCIAVVRTMQALIEINGIGLEVKP